MIYNKRVWQKLYAVSPLNGEDKYQHYEKGSVIMTKRVCCSIILGVITYFFTMMLCYIQASYPELMRPLVFYYSCIIAGVTFLAFGFGEDKHGNKFLYSILFALVVFLFTMLLTIFSTAYQMFFVIIATYYAGMAFIAALIGYVIGERSQKNK